MHWMMMMMMIMLRCQSNSWWLVWRSGNGVARINVEPG